MAQYSESPIVISDQVSLNSLLTKQSRKEVIREIFQGLTAEQKYISSRFFYDDRGSELFEAITGLPEYYPTRVEKRILEAFSSEIMGMEGEVEIVELGSGDCSKISILLDAVPDERLSSMNYYPVDISEEAVKKSAEILAENYPGLKIEAYLADFMNQLEEMPGKGKRLICFFGSTIGNLSRDQETEFLFGLKDKMNSGDFLLIGLDMIKEVEILEAAYNDEQGITEAFNRNILNVVNTVAGTRFIPDNFQHLAYYNEEEHRIEMHLESRRDILMESPLFPCGIAISKGETIHTENSHKYSAEHIGRLGAMPGMSLENVYTDPREWFSLVRLRRT